MDLVVPWIQERFATGKRKRSPTIVRHSATSTWSFPPADRPPLPGAVARTNLKELAARPDRFEHHLIVVARLGCAQLEIATASEPLYFAHVNISDEYAVALPTGDPLLDAFPLRTFVSDRASGADVGRYNHRAGDLVLHPEGFLHWPGKLRPPFQGLDIPDGMRRCGVSLVYCASVPTPSTAEVVPMPPGRKPDDVKPYVTGAGAPKLSLAGLLDGPPGVVARIGGTELELVERPTAIAPPRGGWVVILTGAAPHASCDLIRVEPGRVLAGDGIERALVLSGDAEPEAVPPSWSELPEPPFARYEDGRPGVLPVTVEGHPSSSLRGGSIRLAEQSPSTVGVDILAAAPHHTQPIIHVEVPRYWLARMLYRVVLHELRLHYVETYGGFFIDDSGAEIEIGIRRGADRVSVEIKREQARETIERLYAAVAPPDYTERLG